MMKGVELGIRSDGIHLVLSEFQVLWCVWWIRLSASPDLLDMNLRMAHVIQKQKMPPTLHFHQPHRVRE